MKQIFILMLTTLFLSDLEAQKIATLEILLERNSSGMEIPVKLNIDEVTMLPDSVLVLSEITGNSRIDVPFQVEAGNPRIMNWVVIPRDGKPGEKHVYELSTGKSNHRKLAQATVKDGTLTLHKGSNNLLSYIFKTVYPPQGIDTSYKRSGFIHPLWSPGGEELTRIQPPDHYHHYGIWNPWTQVQYNGDTIDFWNINSKQGSVRFGGFVSVKEGPVFSEFSAIHEHFVISTGGNEEVALNELQKIRVYPQQKGQDFFIVDFEFIMNCATENPFKILEYRYAGLGWRTTQKWDRNNSMVLTSEGKTRKDADGSKARWCIIQGELDNDYAGVVMMSFPTNYNFPEPLRIWPENQYNRGDMFANFCPTKDMDWNLEPGRDYALTYRFLVYNGRTDASKAEDAWHYFANPPKVSIIR